MIDKLKPIELARRLLAENNATLAVVNPALNEKLTNGECPSTFRREWVQECFLTEA